MSARQLVTDWRSRIQSDLIQRLLDIGCLWELDPEAPISSANTVTQLDLLWDQSLSTYGGAPGFLSAQQRIRANAIRRSIIVGLVSHFEQTLKDLFESALILLNNHLFRFHRELGFARVRQHLRSVSSWKNQSDSRVAGLVNLCMRVVNDTPPRDFHILVFPKLPLSLKGLTRVFRNIGFEDIFNRLAANFIGSGTSPPGWTADRVKTWLMATVNSLLSKRNDLVHKMYVHTITIRDVEEYVRGIKTFMLGSIDVIQSLLLSLAI